MSKLAEVITQLALDDEDYPVSRPTDRHQGVPSDQLFAARSLLLAEAFREIEDRLYLLETASKRVQQELKANEQARAATAMDVSHRVEESVSRGA